MRSSVTAVERFWPRVEKSPTCWVWKSAKPGKYGKITDDEGHFWLAHRFAYRLLVGPIPDGMDLDHLCRNTRCVNPAHLEPVTRADNTKRGRIARLGANLLSACKRGHAFSEANTYWHNGQRWCRRCNVLRTAQYKARKEGKIL